MRLLWVKFMLIFYPIFIEIDPVNNFKRNIILKKELFDKATIIKNNNKQYKARHLSTFFVVVAAAGSNSNKYQ